MATEYGTHQFSDSSFEEELSHLKDTQKSIKELSERCLLAHGFAFPYIVKCWLNAIFKGKVDQCLALFHLANEIIQRSKKKGWTDIVSAWEPALLKATPFARFVLKKCKYWIFILKEMWFFSVGRTMLGRGSSTSSRSGKSVKCTHQLSLQSWTNCWIHLLKTKKLHLSQQ